MGAENQGRGIRIAIDVRSILRWYIGILTLSLSVGAHLL